MVVENFKAGIFNKMGFDYENLRSINPKLICASVNGFGSKGEMSDKPAFDFIAQALSGFMSLNGTKESGPMRAAMPISDLVAGFENKYYAQKLWKWSLGVEWRQVPMVPMRLGFAWGGSGNQELGMGFGVKKGPVMFDFGFAFRNGIWLNTMKGFNLSIGATFIGREKNINSKNDDSKGPSPKK